MVKDEEYKEAKVPLDEPLKGPFIGFNDAGYLNISDEASLAMMDEMIKVDPRRKTAPLDAFNNVSYGHRIYIDGYNLMIGDSCFVVPPEFIAITSEATSQDVITLRQESTQKIKTGYHKRTIVIDLVFHGLNQINGFKVESPEGFYYVDGLRQLLAQFKCTPFLPIINTTINGTYDIHTVALQSIVCSTVEGFPDLMTANLTLQEINMFPYIEMHSRWFKYMIDWDLFRFYYQRLLTDKNSYKKLKSIPSDKDLTSFKISALSPRVFEVNDLKDVSFQDIVTDYTIIISDTDENGKETKAKSNYELCVSSDESNVHICNFQCGYSNRLVSIQMSAHGEPTMQYMGGMDTIFSIGFETNDESVVYNLERCQIINDQLVRANKKYSSIGFIKLESELVEFCGSKYVMVDNVTTSTVPGFPGLYRVQIQCTSFDINQSEREEINGMKPFDHQGTKDDAITQDLVGLYNKISQDCYIERKIRKEMELYPDLKLPTYEEIDEVINKIRSFRSTHTDAYGNPLGQLSYSKYPRNPQKMFHGLEQADILDISVNGAGVVTNTDEVAKHLPKYEGYVDPDFYVFYPYTYASIKEASLENGDADPYTSTYKNKTPQPRTEEYTEYTYPDPTHDGTPSSVPVDYVENAGMTSLKQQFINLALSKIGCPYVWGAEGPDSFDCSGFISWCLKKMGIISSRFTTDSILSMTSVFKEKPLSEAKPGDLLHFKSKETRKIGHIAIYLGNNEIVHCGGSTDGTSKVNRRKADYVKFVRAIEVMPLYSSKQDKVVITNPKINYNFNKTLNLQYGSKGSAVEQLQALLNRIDNAELDIDGDFGSGTEQAVKNFQSKNNINPTGVVDSATTDAFEKAAENYTGPAEINSAVEYAYNSPADSGSITENELIEIARVVAAESMGEPYIGQIAVAQCIYDRFTDRKKRWGTLNKVLYTNGAFAKPFDGSLKTTTCLKAVKDVFCNGAKAYPNDQVHYFLSPKASAATFKDRDKNYTRLGVIANHTFWGDRGAGSSQRFITGGGSVDTNVQNTIPQQEEGIDKGYVTQTTKITTGVYNIPDAKKFGRPIIVKTECLLDDTFFADKNKKMKEHINNDINIFNSMFVDMVEYSGKGRLIKAFPTYLFTIVDENGEWLDGRKLWANHYVLRSLVDIQVHASNDMPMSTATITVTNSYDNLSKLPDGMRYYKISNDSEYNSVQKWAYKTFGIVLGFGPKLTDTLVELKNIVYDTMVVRAGCRMHLRMGYGSDPLALPTVMNGFISDLSVGDLMTFVCVSDGVELTNAILSSKPSDINGMFEAQESSNIISNMLCKRAKAFWSKVNDKWGEASKYGVEHFGLYFHEGFFGADTSTWGDWSSRIGNILSLSGRSVFEGSFTNQDQYDLCKNLYRGSYTKDYFTYTSFGELFMDDEKNICFNLYNKTPWDAIQMSVQNTPEYLGMPMYHQFDSRLYYGLPVWLAKYRYDLFNGSVYEECKTFSQMHFIDSLGEIIDNQVTTSSRNLYTNAIVMYTLGKSYHASPILYSDKSMNWSRMKTKILDTSITQNLIGPDAVYQFFGVKVAKNGAVRVGSSQLLYNWERNYQGELFIIGDGSIKPTDYIFMNDGFVDMVGLCTARTVTHSLSANTGFITTITPGMIGFSTLNNSRMSVTLANAITIGASFSSYTAIRKALKDSTEYLGNYYNQAERWLDIGFFGGLGIKGLTTAFVVYKNIELIIKIKNTAKTAFNIVKTGQTLAKISEGIKMAKTAMTGVKIGTMIKTGLSTAGTILAPGIGTIVGLALGFIADWALSFVVDYFAYNNCVCLLPLIYQGEAFCSELTGDKLLLTNGSNLSEEETYPNLDGSPEALSGDIVGEGQTSQTSAATQAALGQTQSYMGNQAIVILDDLGV